MVTLSVTESEKNSPKTKVDDIKSDGIDRKNMGEVYRLPQKEGIK